MALDFYNISFLPLHMRIRKATSRDFEKLKQLKAEFYLWECERDKRLRPEYVKRGLGSRLAKNLKQDNCAFFVADDNGELVGYAGATIEKNNAEWRASKKGHLFNLYVRPGFRRKGIGKRLAKVALDWFKEKKVTDLMILVYSEKKLAYDIYRGLGFRDYIVTLVKNT